VHSNWRAGQGAVFRGPGYAIELRTYYDPASLHPTLQTGARVRTFFGRQDQTETDRIGRRAAAKGLAGWIERRPAGATFGQANLVAGETDPGIHRSVESDDMINRRRFDRQPYGCHQRAEIPAVALAPEEPRPILRLTETGRANSLHPPRCQGWGPVQTAKARLRLAGKSSSGLRSDPWVILGNLREVRLREVFAKGY